MTVVRHLGFLVLCICLVEPGLAADVSWKGAPLKNFVESLHQRGLQIIYSSDVLIDEFVVIDEPTDADPLTALKAALLPYNLTIVDGPAGSLLITSLSDRPTAGIGAVEVSVIGVEGARVVLDGTIVGRTGYEGRLTLDDIDVGQHWLKVSAPGYLDSPRIEFTVIEDSSASVAIELFDIKPSLPEVVVTASHYNRWYQDPQSHTFLERNLLTNLPNIGDEAVRAIAKLPGTAGGGISALHHIRGGEANEILFVVDGLRLYEPYHLKDFQSFVTIIDQNAISGMDFYSGGYPARYGDRMSGVIDMGLREANGKTETELGLSFFNATVLSIGNFGDQDRGEWLVSARRGTLDYILDVAAPDSGGPQYQDFLSHMGWQLSDRTHVSVNILASRDKISAFDQGSIGYAEAKYDNNVAWLKSETNWNTSLTSQTIVSATKTENMRRGLADTPDVLSGTVDDTRDFESFVFKQDWQYLLSADWMFRAGIDYKSLEAKYHYDSMVITQPPFDSILDNESVVIRNDELAPRGSQYAAYFEARWQPTERLILDAGMRWDRQTYTTAKHDEQYSPRVSILYRFLNRTEFRLGWGQYYQAQEINELQIRDGLLEFYPAQRAKHLVASASHLFSNGLDLRVEMYRKSFRSLRPRFENLFDPLVLIPELQPDRFHIDADSASARGVELTLGAGELENGWLWWASYSWAEIKDMFPDGNVERSWDQTHTVKAGFNWSRGRWNISSTASVHTGWPKTELISETVSNPDGSQDLIVSTTPRNSLRYSTFHSLDMRISRQFDVGIGELTGYLDITNVLNRNNPCCLEYTTQTDESGNPYIQTLQRNWLPIVPSLGVLWRF